ncbi:restriction endonuclease [Sphingobacterium sp. LRF_L2]|uniref:restriction endonuclease n=1 Tax=Sphingobacterium sp. LRF_L2 TaxID=3369421 RepID=UPI003F60CC60
MEKSDSIDWKIYEDITKYIYETLGKRSGIKIDGYGDSCKIKGKSGVKHQIDVVTSQPDGITTAIECKYWNKKVTKDTVMKLSCIIQDTTIDKGIIVSKSGFTKDAMHFAQHHNIDIVELREYDENNKETISKQHEIATIIPIINSTIWRPEILKIAVHPPEKEIELTDMYQIQISIGPTIKFSLQRYIEIFQDKLRRRNKTSEIMTERYDVNAYLSHFKDDYPIKISALSFTGVLRKIESQYRQELSLIENVSLIMKSIFEERTFSISENGIIIEHLNEVK